MESYEGAPSFVERKLSRGSCFAIGARRVPVHALCQSGRRIYSTVSLIPPTARAGSRSLMLGCIDARVGDAVLASLHWLLQALSSQDAMYHLTDSHKVPHAPPQYASLSAVSHCNGSFNSRCRAQRCGAQRSNSRFDPFAINLPSVRRSVSGLCQAREWSAKVAAKSVGWEPSRWLWAR